MIQQDTGVMRLTVTVVDFTRFEYVLIVSGTERMTDRQRMNEREIGF